MLSFKEWLVEQDLNESIKVDPILDRELARDQVKALNKILPKIARIKKYTTIKAVKLVIQRLNLLRKLQIWDMTMPF